MKFNLVDSNYNFHSGFSITTIKTKHGMFTGTSQLYDEDKKLLLLSADVSMLR